MEGDGTSGWWLCLGCDHISRSPLYPIFILPVLLLINIKLERSVVSDKKGRIFGSTWQEFGISAAHFCLSYLSSFNLIFYPVLWYIPFFSLFIWSIFISLCDLFLSFHFYLIFYLIPFCDISLQIRVETERHYGGMGGPAKITFLQVPMV